MRPPEFDAQGRALFTGQQATSFRIAAGEVTITKDGSGEMETGTRLVLVLETKPEQQVVLFLDVVEAADFLTTVAQCVAGMLKQGLGAKGLSQINLMAAPANGEVH